MAQTAQLTGEPRDAVRASALWSVIADTRFGKVLALRLLLLVVSALTLWTHSSGRGRHLAQCLLAALIVASFAWSGHGVLTVGAVGPWHLISDVLHLLTAGVWIGALVALSLELLSPARASVANMRRTATALQRFSAVAPAVVALLTLTGLVNSWYLIGPQHLAALWNSSYGRSLLIKLALFLLMLLLAATNRYWLVPQQLARLTGERSPPRALRVSVLAETALAAGVLLVVAWLGLLEPPIAAD
jgi:putative copper resistance protein D